MGYAFPAEWNLAPGVAENLSKKFGPAPAADDYDAAAAPPSAAEIARYIPTKSPEQVAREAAVAQGAAGAAPGQSPAAPGAQKGWTPEVDEQRKKAAVAATAGATNEEETDAPRQHQSPGILIPGGFRPSERSEVTKRGVDPAKLEEGRYNRDVAAGQDLLAGDKKLESAQQQGLADAVYAAAHAKASQDAAEQMQRQQLEKERYIQAEHAKLAQLSAEAQKQVDPEAAKGSVGAQLFGAIAIGLGQFGASLTGGTNAALQIVNANIDHNIKEQETNIANAGKAHDREASLFQQNLAAFGDRERATLATKMQYLDQVKAMADQQYASAKNTMNEADFHAFQAALYKEKAAAADTFGRLTNDEHTTQSSERYRDPMLLGVGATGEAKKDAHEYAEELEKAGIPQALAGLKEVDSRLDTLGNGDIAGVGPVVNHLPSLLVTKEGVANRQAIAHIKNALRKSVAGASLTPGEKAELDKDLEGSGDAASLRNFVHSYRSTLSNQQKNIEAGHGKEGVRLYEDRGGSVKRIENNKRTTPYLKPVE